MLNRSNIVQPKRRENTDRIPSLDKIAQLRNGQFLKGIQNGHKSNKVQKESKQQLYKKTNRKFFTRVLARQLMKLDSKLKNQYRHAYECNDRLYQEGQRLTSRYCNSRICTVCNNIRTAKLINGYELEFNKFKQPMFVTLTIPNVSAADLPSAIIEMKHNFSKIKDLYRKKSEKTWKYLNLDRTRPIDDQNEMWAAYMFKEITEPHYQRFADKLTAKEYRKKAIENGYQILFPMTGIRKLECTYNLDRRDFHPHIHLIVDGNNAAAFIVKHWLRLYPKAERRAQDIKKADRGSLKELFKYVTKIISSNRQTVRKRRKVELYAIDTIMKATYGMRIFQTYGDITKHSEDVDEIQSQTFQHLYDSGDALIIWNYNDSAASWINYDSGEILSKYDPKTWIRDLYKATGTDPAFTDQRKIIKRWKDPPAIAIGAASPPFKFIREYLRSIYDDMKTDPRSRDGTELNRRRRSSPFDTRSAEKICVVLDDKPQEITIEYRGLGKFRDPEPPTFNPLNIWNEIAPKEFRNEIF